QPGRGRAVRVEFGRPVVPGGIGDARDQVPAGVVRGQQEVGDAYHAFDVAEPVDEIRNPQFAAEGAGGQPVGGEEAVARFGAVGDGLGRLAAGQQLLQRPEVDRRVEVAFDLEPDARLDKFDIGGGLDLDVGADGDVVDLDEAEVAVVLVEVAVGFEHGPCGV